MGVSHKCVEWQFKYRTSCWFFSLPKCPATVDKNLLCSHFTYVSPNNAAQVLEWGMCEHNRAPVTIATLLLLPDWQRTFEARNIISWCFQSLLRNVVCAQKNHRYIIVLSMRFIKWEKLCCRIWDKIFYTLNRSTLSPLNGNDKWLMRAWKEGKMTKTIQQYNTDSDFLPFFLPFSTHTHISLFASILLKSNGVLLI